MSGQHVCVLRVRVRLLPPCGYLASDMAYGVVRQGFDPGLQVFLMECIPVAAQTSSYSQGWMHVRNPLLLPMGKRLPQRRATCAGGMIVVSECLS
jgi:hypothetical protein